MNCFKRQNKKAIMVAKGTKSIIVDLKTKKRFDKAHEIHKPGSYSNVFINYLLDLLKKLPSESSKETGKAIKSTR